MSSSESPTPRLLLSSREASIALGVSQRTLFSLRKSGALRAVVIGVSGVRYSVTELQRFIADREGTDRP